MSKAVQAAFFNSATGENVAASFTADKIRAELSNEARVQFVPERCVVVFELFLPFDCGGIECGRRS